MIGHSAMVPRDFERLRQGHLRMASEALFHHAALCLDVGVDLIEPGQLHTRLLETLVPDPFVVSYVSDGWLQATRDGGRGRYREHVVPCRELLLQLAHHTAASISEGTAREAILDVTTSALTRHLRIALLERSEAKTLDAKHKNDMPSGFRATDPSGDALARFRGSPGIRLHPLTWCRFDGRRSRAPRIDSEVHWHGHVFHIGPALER